MISKFLALPGKDKMLFLEAFLLHLWIGLILKFVPFRRIPRLFASRQFEALTLEETQSRPRSESGRQSLLELIKQAIGRAAWVSPWKNRCLVSSLAARRMLGRRGIGSQLSLGVAKGANGRTVAHAWLKAGDFEIVEKVGDFTELYLF